MTTASSTSQSSLVPPRGITTGSFGPAIAVVRLEEDHRLFRQFHRALGGVVAKVQADADDLARTGDRAADRGRWRERAARRPDRRPPIGATHRSPRRRRKPRRNRGPGWSHRCGFRRSGERAGRSGAGVAVAGEFHTGGRPAVDRIGLAGDERGFVGAEVQRELRRSRRVAPCGRSAGTRTRTFIISASRPG